MTSLRRDFLGDPAAWDNPIVRQPPDIDPRLVDFAALGAWMDREGLPGGPLENAEMLAGGTQNVLVPSSPSPKGDEVGLARAGTARRRS